MPNDLVSPAQLKTYMSGLDLDVPQEDAAHEVLDGLVEELELFLNRPIARRERTEVLVPDSDGRLWPSATPIVSISMPTGFVTGGNFISGMWSLTPVTVTYVGGLDDRAEDALRLAVLRAASREMSDRHDDTLSVKDLNADDEPTRDRREPGFTADELKKFDRLRRRTAV